MRAIDADRLKEVLEKNFGHTGGASVLAQLIDSQPTIQPRTALDSSDGEVARNNRCGINNLYRQWGQKQEICRGIVLLWER